MRRGLLGAVTALVVARPLVPGEDPGRLLANTGVADQGFTALWLLVAAVWGIWRVWAGRTAWFGSLVEAGLLGLAVIAFATISQAQYRHPAWLVAAQWGTPLLAFCMVRQLVRSAADNRALLAAMLATGISLAVYAVYQARQPELEPPPVDPTVAEIFDLPAEPAAPEGVAATFVHPATFAGFLVLLFPALVATALASWQAEQLTWRTGILVACCCLCAIALFLTQTWWAILVLTLVGIFAIVVWGRSIAQRGWLLLGLAGLLLIDGLAVGVAGPDRLRDIGRERWQGWAAAMAMIRERPWLGVGPGNFSREFPAKLMSAAVPPAADPHNFLLEVTATLGIAGLIVLLITLLVFFRHMLAADWDTKDEPRNGGLRISMEFYLGGVAGLSLGFVLRYAEVGGANALVEALVALCRSLVWLGAFALLESVPLTSLGRALATAAGVAALLMNLLFEGGIGFSSLAQPLWVMAALTLNALPEAAPAWEGRHWLGRIVPAPVLAVLCLVYFMFAFYPAASASSDLTSARRRFYPPWRDRYELKWRNELELANSAARRIDAARRAEGILKETILNRLEAAVENDPHNAALLAELAYWQGKCWLLFAEIGKIPNEEHANAMRGLQQLYGEAATKTAAQAIELDPHGLEGYQVMVLLRNQFSRPVGPQEQHRQFVLAQSNLAQMVELDPNDARLRFLLAEACFRTGDLAQGRASARQALDLDEQSSSGWRKLTPPQREQALKWVVDTAVR